MTAPPSPATRLKNLTPTALLGTDRAPLATPLPTAAAGASSGAPQSSARTLLTLAASLGPRARAGFNAPTRAPLATEAPIDPRPPTPAVAAATLERILDAPDALLLDEWARAANEHNQRVPDANIPALLDWWSRQQHRSPAIASVLGERARWLATFRPEWERAFAANTVPPNADELWQTAGAAQRAQVLQTVRLADPARGLALLQSTWTTDSADDRRRFLDAIAHGLDPSDEPALESMLADRSKGVRQRAATLLAKIPGSAYRARMRERLAGVLKTEQAKKGLLRKQATTLSLNPPKDLDPSWEKDAIDPTAPHGVGKRAWWLQQLAASCEPAAWQDLTGLDAAAIIGALKDDEYFEDAAAGWFRAAEATPDPAWIEALTALYRQRAKRKVPASWMSPTSLWPLLPRDRHESLALSEITDTPNAAEALTCLDTLLAPWSPSFSSSLLRALVASKLKLTTYDFYSGAPLWTIAARIHQTHAAALDAWATSAGEGGKQDPTDAPTRTQFSDRLRLRIEMHQEFALPTP